MQVLVPADGAEHGLRVGVDRQPADVLVPGVVGGEELEGQLLLPPGHHRGPPAGLAGRGRGRGGLPAHPHDFLEVIEAGPLALGQEAGPDLPGAFLLQGPFGLYRQRLAGGEHRPLGLVAEVAVGGGGLAAGEARPHQGPRRRVQGHRLGGDVLQREAHAEGVAHPGASLGGHPEIQQLDPLGAHRAGQGSGGGQKAEENREQAARDAARHDGLPFSGGPAAAEPRVPAARPGRG